MRRRNNAIMHRPKLSGRNNSRQARRDAMAGPSVCLKTIHRSLEAPRARRRRASFSGTPKVSVATLEGLLRPSAGVTSRNWNLSYTSARSRFLTLGPQLALLSRLLNATISSSYCASANNDHEDRGAGLPGVTARPITRCPPPPPPHPHPHPSSAIVASRYRGIRYSWNRWPARW